jgi:hypothetical protein
MLKFCDALSMSRVNGWARLRASLVASGFLAKASPGAAFVALLRGDDEVAVS